MARALFSCNTVLTVRIGDNVRTPSCKYGKMIFQSRSKSEFTAVCKLKQRTAQWLGSFAELRICPCFRLPWFQAVWARSRVPMPHPANRQRVLHWGEHLYNTAHGFSQGCLTYTHTPMSEIIPTCRQGYICKECQRMQMGVGHWKQQWEPVCLSRSWTRLEISLMFQP